MRYLLDEQLSKSVARALNGLVGRDPETVRYITDLGREGLEDDDVPPLCRQHGVATLITMNVRDFGAKKHYYAALLAHGVHVVVVRPGRLSPTAGQQLAIISMHWEKITKYLNAAEEPILIKVNVTTSIPRDLPELVDEITGLP